MTDIRTVWHERKLYTVDARLTAKQVRQLLDGERAYLRPEIVEGQPCPFAPGDVITIIPHELRIEIERVRKTKDGTSWRIDYLLCDHRPNLMSRTGDITHDRGRAMGASDRAISGNLQEEPERVDPDWSDPQAAEREVRRIESQPESEETRRQARAVRARLQEALSRRSPEGQRKLLARIERQITDEEDIAA